MSCDHTARTDKPPAKPFPREATLLGSSDPGEGGPPCSCQSAPGRQEKDPRKKVWKDGSQMKWAVTLDLMKGKARGRAEVTQLAPGCHSCRLDLSWIKLSLMSEVALNETKNPTQKVALSTRDLPTQSPKTTSGRQPSLVTRGLVGDSPRKAKMEAAESLTPSSKITITVVLITPNSTS